MPEYYWVPNILYLLVFLILFAVAASMENSEFLLECSCETKLSSHVAQTVKGVWFASSDFDLLTSHAQAAICELSLQHPVLFCDFLLLPFSQPRAPELQS